MFLWHNKRFYVVLYEHGVYFWFYFHRSYCKYIWIYNKENMNFLWNEILHWLTSAKGYYRIYCWLLSPPSQLCHCSHSPDNDCDISKINFAYIDDYLLVSFLTLRHNCDVRKDIDQSNYTIVNFFSESCDLTIFSDITVMKQFIRKNHTIKLFFQFELYDQILIIPHFIYKFRFIIIFKIKQK